MFNQYTFPSDSADKDFFVCAGTPVSCRATSGGPVPSLLTRDNVLMRGLREDHQRRLSALAASLPSSGGNSSSSDNSAESASAHTNGNNCSSVSAFLPDDTVALRMLCVSDLTSRVHARELQQPRGRRTPSTRAGSGAALSRRSTRSSCPTPGSEGAVGRVGRAGSKDAHTRPPLPPRLSCTAAATAAPVQVLSLLPPS